MCVQELEIRNERWEVINEWEIQCQGHKCLSEILGDATALTDIHGNLSSNVADISSLLDVVPHFLEIRPQRNGYNKCQDRQGKFPEAMM